MLSRLIKRVLEGEVLKTVLEGGLTSYFSTYGDKSLKS